MDQIVHGEGGGRMKVTNDAHAFLCAKASDAKTPDTLSPATCGGGATPRARANHGRRLSLSPVARASPPRPAHPSRMCSFRNIIRTIRWYK